MTLHKRTLKLWLANTKLWRFPICHKGMGFCPRGGLSLAGFPWSVFWSGFGADFVRALAGKPALGGFVLGGCVQLMPMHIRAHVYSDQVLTMYNYAYKMYAMYKHRCCRFDYSFN